jgi:hypothetical protein
LQSPDFAFKEELRLDNRTLRSVDLVTVEALIGSRSDYAYRTLEEVDFNHDYGFTVLGISRHGVALEDRPMATRLEFGDSLLLLGHLSGVERLRRNENLILLGQEIVRPVNARKAVITVGLLLGIITTAITGVLSPAVAIPVVAVLVVLLGCCWGASIWRARMTRWIGRRCLRRRA